MMKRLIWIFFCIVAIALEGAESPYLVWLSNSVVTSEKVNTNKPFMSAAGTNKEKLRNVFLTSFKKAFPDAVDVIDKRKYKRTSAVFLNISRASLYEVKADDSEIVLYSLPVTATITFMNLVNGEVLYSEVYTHIGNVQTTLNDPKTHDKLVKEYEETYRGLIDELAQKAAKSFVPKRLEAKVIGRSYGLLVLDKGLSEGVGEGDALDGEGGLMLKVRYAAQHYSIAREELGNAIIGSSVSKMYNQSLSDLKKPKVTLLDIQYDREKLSIPPNMFYQFFVDKLAQKGGFSLLSINQSAYKAINSLQESANLGIRFPKRESPEYFMRLWVDGPYAYDLPTNVSYSKNRKYHLSICGDIVDTSARVLASGCKEEKIEDTISFGKGFSKEAQYEVLAKNGALSLAEEFAKKVSFEPISYEIADVEGAQIEIADEKNVLSLGNTLTIYRAIGKIADIEDVFIPIADVSVVEKKGEKVRAVEIMKSFNGAPQIKAGDKIFDQKPKNVGDEAKFFTTCELNPNLGGKEIVGFERAAMYRLAASVQFPFYNPKNLKESIEKRITDTEFERVPSINVPQLSYCFYPAYKYESISSKSADTSGFDEEKFRTVIGVKEYYKGEVVSKYGLGGEKTFYPPQTDKEIFLMHALSQHALENLDAAIKEIEIK